jgi:protein TonB
MPEEAGFHLRQPWQRFAFAAPVSTAVILAMLLASTLIKPMLPHLRESNAIEAQLVEVIPPKPAGLQGGPAAVPAKPEPAQKPHRKAAETKHPKVELAPPISPSEEGKGASVPMTTAPSAKDEAVGIPGGSGVGNGAGLGNDASGARALYAPTPVIPDDMRENPFQALAIAHFKVSPEGVVEVTLAQATQNPRLNQILLETLREWKFVPAMKDGIAIASEFDVRIPISVQ